MSELLQAKGRIPNSRFAGDARCVPPLLAVDCNFSVGGF